MIPVGTYCVVVFTAPHMRKYIGHRCVVTRHGFYSTGPYGTENCMVRMESGEEMPAGFKCLVPLHDDPDARLRESYVTSRRNDDVPTVSAK